MRNSWRHLFRKLAAGCVVAASLAWSSAISYAVQLAYDSPDDPVYAAGWQHGQNGGFGFTEWNFHGTSVTTDPNCAGQGCSAYANPPGSSNWVTAGQQALDNGMKAGGQGSSEFNDIGRAWVLYNPHAPNQGPDNPPFGATDIARVGRGFTFGELQPGHTVSIVIDNPTERQFFRGYTIRFLSGGANGCWNGHNCSTWERPGEITSRMSIGTFEYDTFGRWYATDADPPLFDTDTNGGMRIDFTLTSPGEYELSMTPLANPALAHTTTGFLDGVFDRAIDWIEFEIYNTDSDFYPTSIAERLETDFYIRSIEVTGPAPPGVPGDYNNNDIVDAADYVLWRKYLGSDTQLENEVPDVTSGSVTADDYDAWRARFGNASGALSTSAVGAVPEPRTFVFVFSAAAGFAMLRRGQL
jgi:hypothetical protein